MESIEELVRAASAGDVTARDCLVRRHERLVHATVRRFRLGEADAQDAVQNTWLRMIQHIGSLRDGARLPGWLATTARRECLKILGAANRERIGLTAGMVDRVADPAPNPERRAVDRSMNELLRGHVGRLPARGQGLLTALMTPDAPSYAEVARTTGLPHGSIGPMRMRYLRTLRRQLETAGLGFHDWT